MATTVGWHELIHRAQKMIEQGKGQADLRKEFLDTVGQKLYWLLFLDSKFPNCKILELSQEQLQTLYFADLIIFGNRIGAESLAILNRRKRMAGLKEVEPLQEKEFASWLNEQLERLQKPYRKSEIAMLIKKK